MTTTTKIDLVELTSQLVTAVTDRVSGDKLGQKIESNFFGHNIEARADHLFAACEINDLHINIDGFDYKLAYLSYEYTFNGVTWGDDGTPSWNGDFEVSIGDYADNILFHEAIKEEYPQTPVTDPVQPFDEKTDIQLAKDVVNKVFENIGSDGQAALAKWVWDDYA